MPQLDVATILLACAVLVGVALAVLAGVLSARIFSDASRETKHKC